MISKQHDNMFINTFQAISIFHQQPCLRGNLFKLKTIILFKLMAKKKKFKSSRVILW